MNFSKFSPGLMLSSYGINLPLQISVPERKYQGTLGPQLVNLKGYTQSFWHVLS